MLNAASVKPTPCFPVYPLESNTQTMAKEVAKATVAHLTQEHKLLMTDPVTAWAQTRWSAQYPAALAQHADW